jgi:hypothetical protein
MDADDGLVTKWTDAVTKWTIWLADGGFRRSIRLGGRGSGRACALGSAGASPFKATFQLVAPVTEADPAGAYFPRGGGGGIVSIGAVPDPLGLPSGVVPPAAGGLLGLGVLPQPTRPTRASANKLPPT